MDFNSISGLFGDINAKDIVLEEMAIDGNVFIGDGSSLTEVFWWNQFLCIKIWLFLVCVFVVVLFVVFLWWLRKRKAKAVVM